jgi:hypothetical protein
MPSQTAPLTLCTLACIFLPVHFLPASGKRAQAEQILPEAILEGALTNSRASERSRERLAY